MCKRGLQTVVVCILTEKIRDIRKEGYTYSLDLVAFCGAFIMS